LQAEAYPADARKKPEGYIMKKDTVIPLVSIPVVVIIAGGLALAGSRGGVIVAGTVPLFALCVAIAFAVQWIVYVPSFIGKTEKFYDLAGSLTYTAVIITALVLAGRYDARSILLAGLVLVWTFRLGFFLFRRVMRAGEDRRFREIKQSGLRFLMAWTLQGLWVSFTAAAALGAITSGAAVEFDAFAVAGLCVWLTGFGFEAVADYQKNSFAANPAHAGKFISTGLWSISRHPNYFGEIVIWIGIALIAFPALEGWRLVTLLSPVFVALLITKVSGVPLLEEYADKTWGGREEYERYKKTTPVLVPGLPFY